MKANAYGHGAAGLSLIAELNSDALCVASTAEAEEVFAQGVLKPILIFSPLSDVSGSSRIQSNFVFTVCDIRDIAAFQKTRLPLKSVALKINTGMNRTGILPREVPLALRLVEKAGYRLHSVLSHLYNAFDLSEAERQLTLFSECVKEIPSGVIRHISASSSLFLPDKFILDAVRPGLGIYGYGAEEVEPIAEIFAPILKTFSVAAGEHISYGDYTAPRNMRLAVIPAGYADGIRRKTDPRKENRFVSVNGVLCPIAGQICMDLTVADITNVRGTRTGDRAYFIGNGATAEQPAGACGTNIYEILTAIFSGRIQRVYQWTNDGCAAT